MSAALPNGSASASDRTLACPAWLAFPRVDRSGPWAARGTQLHGYIRDALTGRDPREALEQVEPAYRATCVLIDWSALGGDLADLECEVAYAIDVHARAARMLGHNIGRGYEQAAARTGAPLADTEVPGSLDIKGRHRTIPRRVVVLDTKTGFLDVTPAERNGQGLFFAAAIMLTEWDVDEVEFRIAKVRASGDVWDRDRFVFTRLDVDLFLDEYEAALERGHDARRVYLAGGTPDVAEGSWCDHCPASDHCPAKMRLARAMLSDLAALDARVEAMTPHEVGAAWEKAHDRAAPLLERILDSLKGRIHRVGVVLLPDGMHAAKSIAYPKEQFSAKAALALLEQLGATKEQIAGCYNSVEIKQVRTVNAPKPQRGRAA